MIQIDLGCGMNKQAGFIGVDRYPLSGVDVLVNLNQTLPFRDDSADLIFASHSLEHVEALPAIMKELYRISKHGAQICIIAPYSEQKLNLANPYHHCKFNEHTPSFWTSYPRAPIDFDEFNHPQATQWGLSMSDNSDPGIDIRLVRMECFYFPKYAGRPPSEQRRLRQERMDVCDQIMYHLIVWKGDELNPAKSFDNCVSELQPYEPKQVESLRQRGPDALLQDKAEELEALSAMLANLPNQSVDNKICGASDHDRADMTDRISTGLHEIAAYNRMLRDELATTRENLRVLQAGLESNTVLQAKLSLTQAELEATSALLGIGRRKEESLNAEVAAARGDLMAATEEIDRWKGLYSIARRSLDDLYAEARTLPMPGMGVAGFVIGRRREPEQLGDRFVALREYCDRQFHAAGACLVFSGDLNSVPYREYEIPFDLDTLNSISLAIRPLLPGSAGTAGIEIVSADCKILAQTMLPLADVEPGAITEFRLPVPLTGLRKTWLLRVFVRGAEAPVPLYELAKGTLFRGVTQFLPFVSFT
jgi:hypothetical protein